jgi:hypothetical protein
MTIHIDLAAAVATAITDVAGWDTDRRHKECDRYADLIASGGDTLWAEPDRGHEVAPDQIREAVVNGLAVLAHRPGGVTFGGLHWHATTCETCPGPGVWKLAAAVTSRQDRGAFFTPRTLAEEVVRNTVGPHASEVESLASTSIADIACGSGAFLLAAARYVTQAHLDVWDARDAAYFQQAYAAADARTAATTMALERLYGVDIDPLSVDLARLALALLLPTIPVALPNIRVGDALLGVGNPYLGPAPANLPDSPDRFDWPTEFPEIFNPDDWCSGFEVVIGNPPYLGGKKLTGVLGHPYVDHLVKNIAAGRRGSADLAVYFYLRAHELASRWGTVGIIGPANLTKGGNARVWEDHLAGAGWKAYNLVDSRRWPSKSAAVTVCLRYTSNRQSVDGIYKSFHPDDARSYKYPELRHACGFDHLTPGAVERLRHDPSNWYRTAKPFRAGFQVTWPMHRTCERCITVNAGAGWQILACVIHGEVQERIVHKHNGIVVRPLAWANEPNGGTHA